MRRSRRHIRLNPVAMPTQSKIRSPNSEIRKAEARNSNPRNRAELGGVTIPTSLQPDTSCRGHGSVFGPRI
jgi:hypothetical protein